MHRVAPLGAPEPGAAAKPQTRWSKERLLSPQLPTFVPSELLTVCRGEALRIFLMRATLADMGRIQEHRKEEEWFQGLRKRKRDEAPVYNDRGERVNTVQNIFRDRKMKIVQDILAASARIHKSATSDQRITKKIYFSKAQVESRAYGAILGARGRTHQEIQMSTGCKITLMGRGISDELKNKQVVVGKEDEHRAGMDDAPHAHITAPSEEALRRAVERIEFIISDRPEAIEFRNEKRKEVAIINGTFRPDTWHPQPSGLIGDKVQPSVFARPSAATRNVQGQDAEYKRFKAEVEGRGSGTPGAPAPAAGAPPRPPPRVPPPGGWAPPKWEQQPPPPPPPPGAVWGGPPPPVPSAPPGRPPPPPGPVAAGAGW